MTKCLRFYLPYNTVHADGLERLPGPSNEELDGHRPDVHLIVLDDTGKAAGRCSLWYTHVPALEVERLGIIGHYAASNAECSQILLRNACSDLATRYCSMAVGPMDGSTWRRYRFVTERGTHPRSFLEPENPDGWPQYFEDAGFAPLATYTSALTSDLNYIDPRLAAVQDRLTSMGVSIRPLDVDRFEAELACIFDMSLESFKQNYLYTPAEAGEFLGVYRQALPFVRPELVLMAEHEGQLVGFSFSIPDWYQKERGETVDTVVYKTLAVRPGRAYAGLGSLLSDLTNQSALNLGYKNVIHALMHESNHSRNISDRFATTIRRYTLYSKRLLP
jgi:hypothetical protein